MQGQLKLQHLLSKCKYITPGGSAGFQCAMGGKLWDMDVRLFGVKMWSASISLSILVFI